MARITASENGSVQIAELQTDIYNMKILSQECPIRGCARIFTSSEVAVEIEEAGAIVAAVITVFCHPGRVCY